MPDPNIVTMIQLPVRHWEIVVRQLREPNGVTLNGIADHIEQTLRLVETDQHADGYGTCETCGTTCCAVYRALDTDNQPHHFCRECCASGAAIAHLEELAG